jgi:hypothetical protein
MQEQQLAASEAGEAGEVAQTIEGQTLTAGKTDVAVAEPLTPKTHKRAGITKNHNRGQSKQRRKMAAVSRRRNRSGA